MMMMACTFFLIIENYPKVENSLFCIAVLTFQGPGASCNGQPTSGVTSQEADDIIGVHNR